MNSNLSQKLPNPIPARIFSNEEILKKPLCPTLLEFLNKYTKISQLDRKKFAISKNLRAEVWLVQDIISNKNYVLKIIEKSNESKLRYKSSALVAFEKEISLLRRIEHKNILTIIDFFEDPEKIYVVTENISNCSLFTLIRSKGKLTEQIAYAYFSQVCSALEFLHENNIIHRDLRPETMGISEDFSLKLANFACCAELSDKNEELYFLIIVKFS